MIRSAVIDLYAKALIERTDEDELTINIENSKSGTFSWRRFSIEERQKFLELRYGKYLDDSNSDDNLDNDNNDDDLF